MQIISIKLSMRGMASPRPIVTRFGTRMPQKYMDYKKLIQSKLRGFKKFGNVPLEVELNFFFKPSKSYKKNKYPVPKNDVDNLGKSVLDAMESVLYENDTLVEKLTVTKKYDDVDCIVISIKETAIKKYSDSVTIEIEEVEVN